MRRLGTPLGKERAQAEAQRRVQSIAEAIQAATTHIRIAKQKLKAKKKF